MTPGTRIAHRVGYRGPTPHRWTARVLWVSASHVMLAYDCDNRVSVVERGVVERGWEVLG